MATFIPKKFTKEVISMRISVDLLAEIDEKAAEIGISRNEFINQCITFAMENMEDGENPLSEKTNEKK
ncbi:MAG: CopG family transcriptional regulator [Firmicutes bacterium]|nr:CopG family transcriptional regulator [Bacillota bacterium]